MTVSTVTDSQSRTAAYADPAADRRPPNTASDRNAASSKPIILASLPIVPFIITGAVETFGDLVDRQDAFNGAEGYISGDTIKLKAESQNDAGLAISLKKPISGRLVLEHNGAPESGPLTIQFIKAGPYYDYTKDRIIDQKTFSPHNEAKGITFSVPEGTDKIVVMKVGRGSFDVDISNIEIIKPVQIPAEALCEELRDLNIGLQYYPGTDYKSVVPHPHQESTMDFAKTGNGENLVFKVVTMRYSPGGSLTNEVNLDLTRGILYSCEHFMGDDPNGDYKIDGKALRLYHDGRFWERDREALMSGLNELATAIKQNTTDAINHIQTPPEIQNLVKLLEAYVAKYKDAK